MRKLGIILAVMIAATLGYSGTATAQSDQEPLCEQFDAAAAMADDNPFDDSGEPFTSTFEGAAESCRQSNMDDGLLPSPLLCGVADGLDARDAPGDIVRDANNDVLTGSPLDSDGPPVDFNECGGDDDDCEPNCPGDDDDNNGDDDDAQVEAVQRSNATADGGLPRTGGELFAGAGLGLMSLGALVRRFLP